MIKRRFIGRIYKGQGILEESEFHHLVVVHRARVGTRFIFVTHSGQKYEAEVVKIYRDKRVVLARLYGILENNNTVSEDGVYIAFALFSENRLRFLLEKGTEIGVSGFLPFVAERSKRKRANIREGWYKVIESAVKQSDRGNFPVLFDVMSFKEAVSEANKRGSIYLLDRDGAKNNEIDVDNNVAFVFVGPEGGFADSEKGVLESKARGIISLGRNVLRTETAAIIGAYELIKIKNKRR